MSGGRVLVVGALGRMGERVRAALDEHEGLCVGGALEAPGHPQLGREIAPGVKLSDDPSAALGDCDAAIVFATPEGTIAVVRSAAARGVPCVVGTTGFRPEPRAELEEHAKTIPLVVAANFSVAVNVLFHLARRAAELLGDEFDPEIVELHHAAKIDAPSGTALRLAASVAEGLGRNLDEHAVLAREGITGARPEQAIGIQTLRGGDNP
ncbi:MAG: 4-hydroxy-tetrahydrodipicolinate reductase, partial [Myxococcota bacterium]